MWPSFGMSALGQHRRGAASVFRRRRPTGGFASSSGFFRSCPIGRLPTLSGADWSYSIRFKAFTCTTCGFVAWMQVHGVSQLLTLNQADFGRYSAIVAQSPQDVLASVSPPKAT